MTIPILQQYQPEIAVGLKIFIVEDNPVIRDNLVDTLEELAAVETVGVAETEQEGVNWLSQHLPEWDVAIVDLFLKEGSGIGVIEACKDRPIDKKMVVFSNYANEDVRERCFQLGVDRFFDKSREIDALIDYFVEIAN
ncbi:response regulator transcription factor [Brachymonas sp. G13]|uniref:response regulator transcription factor n=1 Tax=Brachymonas wangyanguii TaxID=3130163 RepID=UPI00386A0FCC